MKWRIISVSIIAIVSILIAYNMNLDSKRLKVFNPAEINPQLVDESKRAVFSNHRIEPFKLINQDNKVFTEKDVDGKIYVADFFFTTCPSICIDMSKQLIRVQEEFKNKDDFIILSHTVQPEVDSVPVLKEYANRHKANPKKWVFLTGDKKEIYDLARKSYFAVTTEGEGGPSDFIHTENFILIDKEGRIRGFYDGTSEEDVDRLMNEVEILYREYNN